MLLLKSNQLPTVSVVEDVLSRSYSEPPNAYSPSPFYGCGELISSDKHKDLREHMSAFLSDIRNNFGEFDLRAMSPFACVPRKMYDNHVRPYQGLIHDVDYTDYSDRVITDEDMYDTAAERANSHIEQVKCIEKMDIAYLLQFIDNALYNARISKKNLVNRNKTIDKHTIGPIYDDESDEEIDSYTIMVDEEEASKLTAAEYSELCRETTLLFYTLQSEGYKYGVNTVTYIINFLKAQRYSPSLKFDHLYTPDKMGYEGDDWEYLPYNVNYDSPLGGKKVTKSIANNIQSREPSNIMWEVLVKNCDSQYDSFRDMIVTFITNCKKLGVDLSMEKTCDWVGVNAPSTVRNLLPTNEFVANAVVSALRTMSFDDEQPVTQTAPTFTLLTAELFEKVIDKTCIAKHIIGGRVVDLNDPYIEADTDALDAKDFLKLLHAHMSAHKEVAAEQGFYAGTYGTYADKRLSFDDLGILLADDLTVFINGACFGLSSDTKFFYHRSGYLFLILMDADNVSYTCSCVIDVKRVKQYYLSHCESNFTSVVGLRMLHSEIMTSGFEL